MIRRPTLIASYPRSGSRWLRHILCNLHHPTEQHDFHSVNRHIPNIDNLSALKESKEPPFYYQTHKFRNGTNVLFLHRHVGDVLESVWWQGKRYHGEQRPFHEYLEAIDYGKEWREFNDFYFPAIRMISYEDLRDPRCVHSLVPWFERSKVEVAVGMAAFTHMQEREERDYGNHPKDSSDLIQKSGTGQWKEWPPELQKTLLEKNETQLRLLGYVKEFQ